MKVETFDGKTHFLIVQRCKPPHRSERAHGHKSKRFLFAPIYLLIHGQHPQIRVRFVRPCGKNGWKQRRPEKSSAIGLAGATTRQEWNHRKVQSAVPVRSVILTNAFCNLTSTCVTSQRNCRVNEIIIHELTVHRTCDCTRA